MLYKVYLGMVFLESRSTGLIVEETSSKSNDDLQCLHNK
jgi:hypothetical protein